MVNMLRPYRLFLWLTAAFAAAGLLCGTFLDLPISTALYRCNAPLSMVMEALCFFPIYFPIALPAALFSVRCKGRAARIGSSLLAGGILTAILAVGASYLYKRGIAARFPLWAWGICCLLPGMLGQALLHSRLKKCSPKALRMLFLLSIGGCCYLLWELATVQGLKALAGRPRYEELLQGGGAFVPWYLFSRQGGASFPSGHTAAACGILLLLPLSAFFPSLYRRKRLIAWICGLHLLLTSLSRIILGKHFLSDVCFAVLLMLAGLCLLSIGYILLRRRFPKLPLPFGEAPDLRAEEHIP